MNRRDFLKTTSLFAFTAAPALSLLSGSTAFAQDALAPSEGVPMDEFRNAALSLEPKFHHYHFLHVPQDVLENIPDNGFTTTTTTVRREMGVSRTLITQNRHTHYHVVIFTADELRAIKAGRLVNKRITVEGSPNHLFTFNDPKRPFQQHVAEVMAAAKRDTRLRFGNQVSVAIGPRRIDP